MFAVHECDTKARIARCQHARIRGRIRGRRHATPSTNMTRMHESRAASMRVFAVEFVDGDTPRRPRM
jgi:hypothetical protein